LQLLICNRTIAGKYAGYFSILPSPLQSLFLKNDRTHQPFITAALYPVRPRMRATAKFYFFKRGKAHAEPVQFHQQLSAVIE